MPTTQIYCRTHLMERKPNTMPSSGPREMVVRARRRAGACRLRVRALRALALPLRARYTDAFPHTNPTIQHMQPKVQLAEHARIQAAYALMRSSNGAMVHVDLCVGPNSPPRLSHSTLCMQVCTPIAMHLLVETPS